MDLLDNRRTYRPRILNKPVIFYWFRDFCLNIQDSGVPDFADISRRLRSTTGMLGFPIFRHSSHGSSNQPSDFSETIGVLTRFFHVDSTFSLHPIPDTRWAMSKTCLRTSAGLFLAIPWIGCSSLAIPSTENSPNPNGPNHHSMRSSEAVPWVCHPMAEFEPERLRGYQQIEETNWMIDMKPQTGPSLCIF
jgi:hypothetical protein